MGAGGDPDLQSDTLPTALRARYGKPLNHANIYVRRSDKRVLRAFKQFLCIQNFKKSKFSRFCKFLQYSQIASNM